MDIHITMKICICTHTDGLPDRQHPTSYQSRTKSSGTRARERTAYTASPVCRELELREGGSFCMPMQGRHLCISSIGRVRWKMVHTFNSWFHALFRTNYCTLVCGNNSKKSGGPKMEGGKEGGREEGRAAEQTKGSKNKGLLWITFVCTACIE